MLTLIVSSSLTLLICHEIEVVNLCYSSPTVMHFLSFHLSFYLESPFKHRPLLHVMIRFISFFSCHNTAPSKDDGAEKNLCYLR